MPDKKVIKKHVEVEVSFMYNKYTKLKPIKAMGTLDPGSLTRSQKKGALRAINLIQENGAEK